jgi:polyisoprenoid-binding protein YceI
MVGAALLLGCSGDQTSTPEETQRDQASLTAMELGTSSLRFTMNKWGDGQGSTKLPVTGEFTNFEVAASAHAHDAETLDELEGLTATITIDLTSVATGMPLRDDNIRTHYFEAAQFGSAVFTLGNLRAQGQGTSGIVRADGELDLHGYTQRFPDLALRVQRNGHAWRVESAEPIRVHSQDFGLPVAALLAACGHPGLDEAASVEVAFDLMEHAH